MDAQKLLAALKCAEPHVARAPGRGADKAYDLVKAAIAEAETTPADRIRVCCSTCGSVNVTRDALARWSEELQQWEISSELDNSDCDDCGGETTLKDVPISPDHPFCQCQNCDYRGLRSHLKPIKHLAQRVDAGEPMPAGECPHCHALCHIEAEAGQ